MAAGPPDAEAGTPRPPAAVPDTRLGASGRPPTPQIPLDAYRADRGKLQTARQMALLSAVVAALNLVPVAWLGHLHFPTAPAWAQAALVIAVLEMVYALWVMATPDWSALWVLTLVFAVVAAAYGMALGMALATSGDTALPLDFGPHRRAAPRWIASALLLHLLASYLCGRVSIRWRRSYEVEMAVRLRDAVRGKW